MDRDGQAVREKRWAHAVYPHDMPRPIHTLSTSGGVAYIELREGDYAALYKVWMDGPCMPLNVELRGELDLRGEE